MTAALTATSHRPATVPLVAPGKGLSGLRQVERLTGVIYPAALAAVISSMIWLLPQGLSADGRLALIVTALCVIGWTMTRIPDSIVAVSGVVLLVGLGVMKEADLYASLGNEMVWLLVASFVIAATLKASGLLERAVFAVLRPFATVTGFLYGLAGAIAMTAFFLPSTSGRAALLLPVFLALAERIPDPRLVRPLALLFPTVILLSAGGSLIGAGAHFVAVQTIGQTTGIRIDYLDWIVLAFPFALISSLAGVWLIIALFVPSDLRRAAIAADARPREPLSRQQIGIIGALMTIIALWVTIPLHGFGIAIVAVAGAVLMLTAAMAELKPKEAFRNVEMELIVFLAATIAIAGAMTGTGADRWLASGVMAVVPETMTGSLPLIVTITALTALTAHIVINSRSARAAVLIPGLALPMAGLGHDLTLLVLVTVLGTGFCQTMMASAKPVALYGNLDRPTFEQKDLTRLALPLLPVMFALLVGFALYVWPHQVTAPSAPAAQATVVAVVSDASASGPTTVIPAATQPAPVPTARPEPMPGALCTRNELRTVMLATIGERRMWASGWWHVWDTLRKSGVPVEKSAVKAIYRGDDMVRLRDYSTELHAAIADKSVVAEARQSCAPGA